MLFSNVLRGMLGASFEGLGGSGERLQGILGCFRGDVGGFGGDLARPRGCWVGGGLRGDVGDPGAILGGPGSIMGGSESILVGTRRKCWNLGLVQKLGKRATWEE